MIEKFFVLQLKGQFYKINYSNAPWCGGPLYGPACISGKPVLHWESPCLKIVAFKRAILKF
jgi:hypothetical protein